MQVLIVDDEPIALKILVAYVGKAPQLQVAGVCNHALEAFSVLSRQRIDLILLDINMPELSGIDFIKALKNPPAVIFTTAYPAYAVESYELSAVDYLVKPIRFERFLQAVNKLTFAKGNKQEAISAAADNPDILFVKSDGKLVKVDLNELWLIESLKDYVCLHTGTVKILVLSTLQHLADQLLANPSFIRVSRSCIINMKHIREVDGNTIRLKDQSVTIGTTYRTEVFETVERFRLL